MAVYNLEASNLIYEIGRELVFYPLGEMSETIKSQPIPVLKIEMHEELSLSTSPCHVATCKEYITVIAMSAGDKHVTPMPSRLPEFMAPVGSNN